MNSEEVKEWAEEVKNKYNEVYKTEAGKFVLQDIIAQCKTLTIKTPENEKEAIELSAIRNIGLGIISYLDSGDKLVKENIVIEKKPWWKCLVGGK